MLSPERHRQIVNLLAEHGSVSMQTLQARLRVSSATLRRDVASLAMRGLLQRTHGGVLQLGFALRDATFEQKQSKAATIKVRLGQTTADLLPVEGTVFIDGGTTCLEVGRALLERPQLSLFTNSVPLLALAGKDKAKLTAIGGEVRPGSLALTGGIAQSWLEHLHFDAAAIGCSGLDMAKGPATTELAEASLKVELLRRSRLRFLVLDARKWDVPAAVVFAPWRAFTHIVTNRTFTRAERAALQATGTKIHTLPLR